MERTHQGLSTSEVLKIIDHGLGTMKLNANNRFETWNLQVQGHRQRSQWVELIKVYLHVKFERGIANGHPAMNLNAKTDLTLKLGTFQGQGHRQRSQRVELIKVYLHVKFERGIVNGHPAMNLNAKTDLTLKLGTFKVKVTDKGHNR